jgi:hypothetical protein
MLAMIRATADGKNQDCRSSEIQQTHELCIVLCPAPDPWLCMQLQHVKVMILSH